MVKLLSYTFRFFSHNLWSKRNFISSMNFILFFFFRQELFDHFFILPWFDCFSYWNWSPTRNVLYTTPERKKEKTWNLIKRWLKIPIPGFFPNNIFPTFRLLLKASLNLLKTSLAAITLLFFRSNPYLKQIKLKPCWEGVLVCSMKIYQIIKLLEFPSCEEARWPQG